MTRQKKSANPRLAHEAALGARLDSAEISLGPWASDDLVKDPKRLVFVLARYKFVAKMLAGKDRVLEAGCGDALGLPIVTDAVGWLYAIDWEARVIDGNRKRLAHLDNVTFITGDLSETASPSEQLPSGLDAAFSIDVIEHIASEAEDTFMDNQVACLKPSGVMIVGTPNITASAHASEQSRQGHINLKSFATLKLLMERYFDNVFMFGMNDELVHTGFGPMSHYLFALGAGLRKV
jgi:2-polyprenyl-3-methyl-5-hydroxy-6-metoxy-1,4-benzoquinol methylase